MAAGGPPAPRLRAAGALGMGRCEMLGERQVAAPLMPRRPAHRALRPAHRRLQPGPGIGIQLRRLRRRGKPQRPAPRQLRHQPLILRLTLLTPAPPHPRQHRAMRRQRRRQAAPCGHTSTVRHRSLRPVLPGAPGALAQEGQNGLGEQIRLGTVDQVPSGNGHQLGGRDPLSEFGNPVLGDVAVRAAADDQRRGGDAA